MFKKTFSPRISEVNGARHIGHNAIPVWFEEGLIEITRIFTPKLVGTSTFLVLTNVNIDFVGQIFLGTDVEIITGLNKIGNSSFVLHHEIYQNGKLCVEGNATYVNFSPKTQKSVPIPPSVRKELEAHLIERPD